MDLSAYKDVDPDRIYRKGSKTFIYTYGGDLIVGDFPDTHTDLAYKNFDLIFGDPSLPRKIAGIRDQHTRYSIAGRIGFYYGKLIIAIWNDFKHPLFKPCLKILVEKYPRLEEASAIVVGKEQEPKLLSDLLGKKATATATTTGAPFSPEGEESDVKLFKIGGQYYSKKDLGELRKAAHSQAWRWEEIRAVLCHPDMEKYPELEPYIPSKCHPYSNTKPKWSDWLRAAQLPVENQKLYFKAWLLSEQSLWRDSHVRAG